MAPCPSTPVISSSPITSIVAPCSEPASNQQGILHPQTTTSNSRTLYLTRHGESLNNLYGRIGGNAKLSERGEKYARALADFVARLKLQDSEVWVTQYQRTQQTARHLPGPHLVMPELGEIQAGAHDGLTYEEIAAKFPVEFALRDADKLRYRYPEGESYIDVVQRIQPILKRIELQDNLVVISHQATLRCLLALLLGGRMEELPYTQVPLHTVIKVVLQPDGKVTVEEHRLPVDCVDTHRAKPLDCTIQRPLEQACLTVPHHL